MKITEEMIEAATQAGFKANAPMPEGLGLRLTHFRSRWIAIRMLEAALTVAEKDNG